MTKINLLLFPKTEGEKRASRVQIPVVLAGILLLALLGGMGYGKWYLTQTAERLRLEKVRQSQELARLKLEVIEVANFEANKKLVQEKIQAIEQLQRNQTIPIRLLLEISDRLPERVWLIGVAEQAGQIQLEGKATGNGEIVAFMDALRQSAFFEHVEIEESRQVIEANTPIYTFKLKWQIRTPSASEQAVL